MSSIFRVRMTLRLKKIVKIVCITIWPLSLSKQSPQQKAFQSPRWPWSRDHRRTARLSLPPKLPRRSAVSSVSFTPSPCRVAPGRGGWIFLQRVRPSRGLESLTWLESLTRLSQCWLESGWQAGAVRRRKDPPFPCFIPSSPEASNQKRSERRGTQRSEKGRDQGVSQDLL